MEAGGNQPDGPKQLGREVRPAPRDADQQEFRHSRPAAVHENRRSVLGQMDREREPVQRFIEELTMVAQPRIAKARPPG